MARFMAVVVAVLLVLGVTAASAEVIVLATIDVNKDINILENVFITKNLTLEVDVVGDPDSAAKASAYINQTNQLNEACENCAEKGDLIENSINGNGGVVNFNQSAGNHNNQGNALSVSIAIADTEGFANGQAGVDQLNTQNTIETFNIQFRDADINGSINENLGIVQVNQSPSNQNNQANSLGGAVALAPGIGLSESDLGQENINQFPIVEKQITRQATVLDSINTNTGVVQVNQTVGNMANQGNVTSVGAAANALF